MVSPHHSTPLQNTGYTEGAASAANVDSSVRSDKGSALTNTKKSQALTAPRHEQSVIKTPHQQAKELWSTHPALSGQALILSQARRLQDTLPQMHGLDQEGHDERITREALEKPELLRSGRSPTPLSDYNPEYHEPLNINLRAEAPVVRVKDKKHPKASEQPQSVTPQPDTQKLSVKKSAEPSLKAAKSTTRDVNSQTPVNFQKTSPTQWKSLEERTMASFKNFVADPSNFATHGNKKFLKKHVETASQSQLEVLGKGAFKQVFGFTGEKLVAATLNLRQIKENEPYNLGFSSHEVEITKAIYDLKLPSVVKGGVLENKETGDYHIFTKRCSEGNARDFWRKATPEQKAKLLLDFATGTQTLHDKGYVHRDIKASNMFVDIGKNGELRGLVGDLGCASSIQNPSLELTYNPTLTDAAHIKQIGRAVKEAGGSPEDIQEAMHKATHDPKMDTFAFGLMICCMELGYDQDKREEFQELAEAIGHTQTGQIEVKNLIDKAFPIDSPLKQLVKDMMASDRKVRPADTEICQRLSEIDPNVFDEAYKARILK